MNNSTTCDECGSHKNIVAGEWIFYCPDHKALDRQIMLENELRGDDSDLDYMLANSERFEEVLL